MEFPSAHSEQDDESLTESTTHQANESLISKGVVWKKRERR